MSYRPYHVIAVNHIMGRREDIEDCETIETAVAVAATHRPAPGCQVLIKHCTQGIVGIKSIDTGELVYLSPKQALTSAAE